MNKILFLSLILSLGSWAASNDVIVEGDQVNTNCVYVKFAPTKWDMSQSCGTSERAQTKSFCVGMVQCDYVNIRTKDSGKHYRTVGCEANPNGSCPPPKECNDATVDFLVKVDLEPKVQSKAEAALADQRARQYGNRSGVGQTTHTSGGR